MIAIIDVLQKLDVTHRACSVERIIENDVVGIAGGARHPGSGGSGTLGSRADHQLRYEVAAEQEPSDPGCVPFPTLLQGPVVIGYTLAIPTGLRMTQQEQCSHGTSWDQGLRALVNFTFIYYNMVIEFSRQVQVSVATTLIPPCEDSPNY